MSARLLPVLVLALMSWPDRLPMPADTTPPSVVFAYDVRIPMRDGATLSADVYRPNTTDKVPVILVRTPYDNGVATHVAAGKWWAARGYAYVVQDVRGRGESDGEFYPLVHEALDATTRSRGAARRRGPTARSG